MPGTQDFLQVSGLLEMGSLGAPQGAEKPGAGDKYADPSLGLPQAVGHHPSLQPPASVLPWTPRAVWARKSPLPKSRLTTLWSNNRAAPWSLPTMSWCLSMTQVTVVWSGRDSGGKASPRQGINATGRQWA
ncbi:hypothetical protein HJG60_020225 [Phyllostomus discolor]|uniref:Uncharacterized protein n=1 Tax=Phyllostomus discolor TaxID=89673 RepID=A0A834AWV5_9CHIR|nr:hypothetical protein HJG60_020225 [Phyllostomus discolor]